MDYEINQIKITSTKYEGIQEYIDRTFKLNLLNHFITFNLDFLHTASINPVFSRICKKAQYVFPDGYGLLTLLKLKYDKSIERITGHDLFIELLKYSDKMNLPVALLGASENVLNKTVQRIKSDFPGCKIVSAISPPLFFEKNEVLNKKIIDELCSSKPQILIVALGSPRQEIWIDNYKNIINAKVNIGVGSVFDYYSREKIRCPEFLQHLRLEWFWRFAFEPVRLFKRYFIDDLPFFILQYIKILKEKHGK